MWLTYVDESGNTGTKLDDPLQPFHVLVGVSVREDLVTGVAAHLDDVAARWLGTAERTAATELHASQLKGGNGPWTGVSPADRIEVYRQALAPLSWDGVVVTHAAINKAGLARRADGRHPHMWALQFLVEKLNGYFTPRGERTLLVADETNEHEQFALELLVNLQTGRPRPGLQLGDIENVIDTVHFVRSETNRGVQLADLVAYLRSRLLARPSTSLAEAQLWSECVDASCVTWRAPWPG